MAGLPQWSQRVHINEMDLFSYASKNLRPNRSRLPYAYLPLPLLIHFLDLLVQWQRRTKDSSEALSLRLIVIHSLRSPWIQHLQPARAINKTYDYQTCLASIIFAVWRECNCSEFTPLTPILSLCSLRPILLTNTCSTNHQQHMMPYLSDATKKKDGHVARPIFAVWSWSGSRNSSRW